MYFPSEKYFSDERYVCPIDPSAPSENRFVHRIYIAGIGHYMVLTFLVDLVLPEFQQCKQTQLNIYTQPRIV